MKKIAILGTGAIGGILSAYLNRAGLDVTTISAYRPEIATAINSFGIDLSGVNGSFHVHAKASFLDDLTERDVYDYIFLGLKANNYSNAVKRIAPHLAQDGCIITLQNGINDDILIPIVGKERVVIGISFAGGKQVATNHYEDHDGHFVIGEIDGQITPRLDEIAEILRYARPTQYTDNIRKWQWEKLGTVALHVPLCTITGTYMQEAFGNPYVQQFFGLMAKEIFEVAEADGCKDALIMGKSKEQWASGGMEMPRMPASDSDAQPKNGLPDGIVDAYTKDIRKGAELEIDFTNGSVVRLGKRYGVPTPVNDAVIAAVRAIEAGSAVPGNEYAKQLLSDLEKGLEVPAQV